MPSEDIDVDFDINESFVEIPAEDIDSDIRFEWLKDCLLYTSPSPRDLARSRMPSSA